MNKVRIGGVPEHFNMPWQYGIRERYFQNANIDLEWNDFPGGTGAMATALRSNELDLALMLTEGAIADIHNGADTTILGYYVKSPLIWGIHVASDSSIINTDTIKDKKFAISRKGSGSHLMAMVYANENDFSIQESQFAIVNSIDGAIKSLTNKESDVFFWEKFMTMKHVVNNTFRRIGEYPTPWPCFVLVVKNSFYTNNKDVVEKLIDVIEKILVDFKNIPQVARLISEKYKLEDSLVNEWLKTVEWSKQIKISKEEISNVKKMLTKVGALV